MFWENVFVTVFPLSLAASAPAPSTLPVLPAPGFPAGESPRGSTVRPFTVRSTMASIIDSAQDYFVATAFFGLIHGTVGFLNQFVLVIRVQRESGDAD